MILTIKRPECAVFISRKCAKFCTIRSWMFFSIGCVLHIISNYEAKLGLGTIWQGDLELDIVQGVPKPPEYLIISLFIKTENRNKTGPVSIECGICYEHSTNSGQYLEAEIFRKQFKLTVFCNQHYVPHFTRVGWYFSLPGMIFFWPRNFFRNIVIW